MRKACSFPERGHPDYVAGPKAKTHKARQGYCPECFREYRRRYRTSEKGKATSRKYEAKRVLEGHSPVSTTSREDRAVYWQEYIQRPEVRLSRRLGISVKVAREMVVKATRVSVSEEAVSAYLAARTCVRCGHVSPVPTAPCQPVCERCLTLLPGAGALRAASPPD